MVGIDNLDELELSQYQEFFQLVLLLELGILICQQHVGIFNPQSTQHHTLIPYRDRSDQQLVCF